MPDPSLTVRDSAQTGVEGLRRRDGAGGADHTVSLGYETRIVPHVIVQLADPEQREAAQRAIQAALESASDEQLLKLVGQVDCVARAVAAFDSPVLNVCFEAFASSVRLHTPLAGVAQRNSVHVRILCVPRTVLCSPVKFAFELPGDVLKFYAARATTRNLEVSAAAGMLEVVDRLGEALVTWIAGASGPVTVSTRQTEVMRGLSAALASSAVDALWVNGGEMFSEGPAARRERAMSPPVHMT